MERLQELHKLLRRAKYFYYEQNESIMSDYEFDTLEKEYDILCNEFNISEKIRVSNFVGFSIMIPMSVEIK